MKACSRRPQLVMPLPPCAPKHLNHAEFFSECKLLSSYFVVRDYSHMDMLDDDVTLMALMACQCSEGCRGKIRRSIAGLVIAFLEVYFDSNREDLNVVVADPGVAPVTLDPVQEMPAAHMAAMSRFDRGTLSASRMVGFKNRYMVMEVFIDPNRDVGKIDPILLSQFNVSKAIKESILANFGECGLASSFGSFQVKYVNPITKICIIRASREDYQKVWCAITMVRNIGNCPVLFNLLDLSGSIRACRNAALKCDEAKFEHYKLVAGDHLTDEIVQHVKNSFEKIKILEH